MYQIYFKLSSNLCKKKKLLWERGGLTAWSNCTGSWGTTVLTFDYYVRTCWEENIKTKERKRKITTVTFGGIKKPLAFETFGSSWLAWLDYYVF